MPQRRRWGRLRLAVWDRDATLSSGSGTWRTAENNDYLGGPYGWQTVRGQPDFYKQTEEKARGKENGTWDFIDVLPWVLQGSVEKCQKTRRRWETWMSRDIKWFNFRGSAMTEDPEIPSVRDWRAQMVQKQMVVQGSACHQEDAPLTVALTLWEIGKLQCIQPTHLRMFMIATCTKHNIKL